MIIRRSKRKKKILSIRSKFGRKETHEMLLFKSNKSIYAYVLCLSSMRVLFGFSSLSVKRELDVNEFKKLNKMDCSRKVGSLIGRRCKKEGFVPVINVANYKFHGHVKTLVEGFREEMNINRS